MKAGENRVMIRYSGTPCDALLDCIKVDGGDDEPYARGMTVSQTSIGDISQTIGGTDVVPGRFTVSADGLSGDLVIASAGDSFEVSLEETEGYSRTLAVDPSQLKTARTVYVRLCADAGLGNHAETLTLSTPGVEERVIRLGGVVNNHEYTTTYDFESDPVTAAAANPPAAGITVGAANRCSAGVVNLTDQSGHKSQMLKIYGAPSNNSTGVLNLDNFTTESTDYSVTWRQVISSTGNSYKNGVLMRGDVNTVGTASSGYTQGIMAGYYLSVYNNGGNTEFRVYRSTSQRALQMINSRSVALPLVSRGSMWYRASVSGSTKVTLRLEYSTDGENWQEGTSTTDEGGTFSRGATQFVWGLAASERNFWIDDITYRGYTFSDVSGIESIEYPASATVVREEYFDISGRRLRDAAIPGIVICRTYMSDGSIVTRKITGRR